VRPRREEPHAPILTLFIDRCLGQGEIVNALRGQGETVSVHDDHFATDCPDETWISDVSVRGWIILTKDQRVRRRPAELAALRHSNAAVFVLTAGGLSGAGIAQAFTAALPRMKRILRTHTRPLVATVSSLGGITVVIGDRRGGRRKDERPGNTTPS
jgi:hypothetical protein